MLKNRRSTPKVLQSKACLGNIYADTPLPTPILTSGNTIANELKLEDVAFGDGLLSPEWIARAKRLLTKKKNCFSTIELDMGYAKCSHYHITLKEICPFRQRQEGPR